MPCTFFVGLLVLTFSVIAQTSEPVPGDNLVVEGIPNIPASLTESVGRYIEFRTAALLSWHPQKREMLISTRFADAKQVHQVKFPGGARAQMTFFKESVDSASYQPKEGDYFIFSKDTGGDEFFQFYRYDFASGDITLFTDGKSRNTGVRWSNAGDRLAYGSTRRNGKDVDFYIVDPSTQKSDCLLVQLEGGGWRIVDWSSDDRALLVVERVSINESYLWLVDVVTRNKTLLTPKGGAEKIAYAYGMFSKDSKGIYVRTDRDSEFLRLAYIDLATKQHTFLTDHIKWDVDEFDLSQDGKTIAFITNEEGIGVFHLLDVATGKERAAPALPVGVISGVQWHRNGKDLGFYLESTRSTADVYSVDSMARRFSSSTTDFCARIPTRTLARFSTGLRLALSWTLTASW